MGMLGYGVVVAAALILAPAVAPSARGEEIHAAIRQGVRLLELEAVAYGQERGVLRRDPLIAALCEIVNTYRPEGKVGFLDPQARHNIAIGLLGVLKAEDAAVVLLHMQVTPWRQWLPPRPDGQPFSPAGAALCAVGEPAIASLLADMESAGPSYRAYESLKVLVVVQGYERAGHTLQARRDAATSGLPHPRVAACLDLLRGREAMFHSLAPPALLLLPPTANEPDPWDFEDPAVREVATMVAIRKTIKQMGLAEVAYGPDHRTYNRAALVGALLRVVCTPLPAKAEWTAIRDREVAFKLLGQLRAVEAISDLIGLQVPRPLPSRVQRVIDTRDVFQSRPAAEALYAIGEPSISPLLAYLSDQGTNELGTSSLQTLVMLLGYEGSKRTIRNQRDAAADWAVRQNFTDCLDLLETNAGWFAFFERRPRWVDATSVGMVPFRGITDYPSLRAVKATDAQLDHAFLLDMGDLYEWREEDLLAYSREIAGLAKPSGEVVAPVKRGVLAKLYARDARLELVFSLLASADRRPVALDLLTRMAGDGTESAEWRADCVALAARAAAPWPTEARRVQRALAALAAADDGPVALRSAVELAYAWQTKVLELALDDVSLRAAVEKHLTAEERGGDTARLEDGLTALLKRPAPTPPPAEEDWPGKRFGLRRPH